MKTPPMLVGAALLFWGWQTEFFIVATVLAVVLEGSRYVRLRWEMTTEDFSRIWTFCTLLLVACLAYAFSASNGPANLRGIFSSAGFMAQNTIATVSTRTAVLVIRWLPLVYFFFIAAQAFSNQEGIPMIVVSSILRRRWKKLKKLTQPMPPMRSMNMAYPYFILCLFAACTHPQPSSGENFFFGLCGLLMWGLWPFRSRRFSTIVWAGAMALAMSLGFGGQRGLVQLQRAIVQYNPQWLADLVDQGFDPIESRTEIGQIGRIKTSHKIVLRLKTMNDEMPPAYLREAAYRQYKSGVWYSGSSKDDFTDVNDQPRNSGNYPLFETKNPLRTLNIACYLAGGKGLLPLPTETARLEQLQAIFVQKNHVGTVHAQGPGLVIFDALYGYGSAMDYPPDNSENSEDLSIPEKERSAVEHVVSELHLDGLDDDKKLLAISHFFGAQFTYSLWQEPTRVMDTNMTPLGRFLLQTHKGHCEYFATATVLLLRQLHIPARYTVGYAVHEKSGSGYVVRQNDAHAWCRVYNERRGRWENFDTTPGIWMQAEREQRSSFQFISDWWSRAVFEFSKFRWGQSRLRQLLPWVLVPVLALMLFQILFRSNARRARKKSKQKSIPMHRPGMDSEFYELERALVQRGAARRPGEPLSDWLRRTSAAPELSRLNEPLEEILRLHYRYRFDPKGLDMDHRERLRREVAACMIFMASGRKA
ncbi:MAG TPA: transglutaminase domain-containing protein [Verrucomicrobiae bacterium]|nr:transglutaminase domain-containing protein [Verrucomicrobiae bacterium]